MGVIETDTVLLVGMLLALGAGALSFLSPCVLPIFPAYLSYITGISVKELQGKHDKQIRNKLLTDSIFFLLGGALVCVGLGIGGFFLGRCIEDFLFGVLGLVSLSRERIISF